MWAAARSAGLVERMRLLWNGALGLRKEEQEAHIRAERVELRDAAQVLGVVVSGMHHTEVLPFTQKSRCILVKSSLFLQGALVRVAFTAMQHYLVQVPL